MGIWPGITVLVFGISGVGKTRLIQEAIVKFPGAVAWRASEMIAEARKVSDPETLRALSPEEIKRSQELLLSGFEARRRVLPGVTAILDAHSVIDTDIGLYAVPIEVVKRLGPSGMIHVDDDIERIQQRRLSDHDRRRPIRTRQHLQEYQRQSLLACEGYQAALGSPLIRVFSGDDAGFVRAIADICELRRADT